MPFSCLPYGKGIDGILCLRWGWPFVFPARRRSWGPAVPQTSRSYMKLLCYGVWIPLRAAFDQHRYSCGCCSLNMSEPWVGYVWLPCFQRLESLRLGTFPNSLTSGIVDESLGVDTHDNGKCWIKLTPYSPKTCEWLVDSPSIFPFPQERESRRRCT